MATLNYADAFEAYLLYEKRYSSHTIRAYTDDLHQFFNFLAGNFDITSINQIRPAMIRTWLAKLKDEDHSAKTINRKISTLKTYYKFLQKNGYVQQSPLLHISSPKISKRLPQYVEQKDMRILFQHVGFSQDYQGALHRMVLALLYYTGMRKAELQHLQEKDVDLFGKTLKVLGKGNKERVIPMVEELQTEIKSFLEAKEKLTDFDLGPCFLCNEKGAPLYPKYIYNTVKRYLSLVTTISKKSPHILRHSFATHLTNNGAELNAIKELLGHASLAATQIYTHNSIEKLKSIHKKSHPKA